MAFSTQKEFFHVPFMNQTLEYECKKACVKLKSYESTIDDRSWAIDEAEPSRFLYDLVKCNTPKTKSDDDDKDKDKQSGASGGGTSIFSRLGGFISRAKLTGDDDKDYCGPLEGADSVLKCANENLCKLNELLNEKKDLQKKLQESNECLQTAREENEKIKNIMGQKFDMSHIKDFHNKIQKLVSSGKLNKSEENELLNIFYKLEDMFKSYEILQAENSYLKRMVEKLSKRCTLNSIQCEPETSRDVSYLQNQVNTMRKELTLLRKTEDDRLKSSQDARQAKTIADQDAQRLKEIIKERNALRDKCKSFKDLEKKIRELQKKAQAADNISCGLSKNLNNQSGYICEMEKEMQRMQKYYEEEMQKLKYCEELLKCQLQDLKEELCRANCKAQKADCLQMEIGCLRNELLKRELALGDYDCQYKQLMHKAKSFKSCGYRLLMQSPEADQNNYVSDN